MCGGKQRPAAAGADTVKLQTYTPDTMTIDCQAEHFRIGQGTIWEGKNLYQLYDEVNLRTTQHVIDVFCVPIGWSDHTLGVAVPVAAVALGACIVEKHSTMSRHVPGPDSAFSLEPPKFKSMDCFPNIYLKL